jgi:2-amino-4-hydroxy-6-hydroxymethyldihydropteridine diphosphokinase
MCMKKPRATRAFIWLRPMPDAAIALGSNLGDRIQNLNTAIAHVCSLGQVKTVSSFIDTPPAIYFDQPRFLNAALILDTTLPPLELLESLLAIERTMGRRRTGIPPKGPRLIDLDLILYGQEILETETLILPHAAMAERAFVLAPLAEIAPDWVHPMTQQTIAHMLSSLTTQEQA